MSADDYIGKRLSTVEAQTELHRRLILGDWETDPDSGAMTRVPGLLEQSAKNTQVTIDIMKTLKKRDEDEDTRRVEFRRTAWKIAWTIGGPVISGIFIIMFFTVVSWTDKNAALIRSVTGH